MLKLNIHEIKSQLSKYIDMVEAGETVVVCKRNIPVAEIRAIEKKKKRTPILGSAAGLVDIKPSFYEPMTEEELADWEGGPDDPLREFAPNSRTAKPKRKK
jgi:antitoxin (DNA-binding transcriptional repressor) of toxin-antitoxin stability system